MPGTSGSNAAGARSSHDTLGGVVGAIRSVLEGAQAVRTQHASNRAGRVMDNPRDGAGDYLRGCDVVGYRNVAGVGGCLGTGVSLYGLGGLLGGYLVGLGGVGGNGVVLSCRVSRVMQIPAARP